MEHIDIVFIRNMKITIFWVYGRVRGTLSLSIAEGFLCLIGIVFAYVIRGKSAPHEA